MNPPGDRRGEKGNEMADVMLCHLEKLEADSRALADVRTLDGSDFAWESGWFSVHGVKTYTCLLFTNEQDSFKGSTADEARAKAAAWVRGMK